MGRSGMIRLVGVEIGGTKQQIAVGTARGEILDRRTVRLGDKTSAGDILMWLEDNIREIQERWEIGGIGVGFGGPLEFKTGRVLCSLQVPGWMDFRLKEWFEEQFGVPAVIVNDTVLGGIGELVLGNGAGSSRFFYTNIGTGIEAACIWTADTMTAADTVPVIWAIHGFLTGGTAGRGQ